MLTDDAEIRELNRQWRDVDEATDVLSFAMQEAPDASMTPDLLGDIVISVPTASRYAESLEHARRVLGTSERSQAWTLVDELTFLVIHGALHLLGYDHATKEEELEMKAEERRVYTATMGDRPMDG